MKCISVYYCHLLPLHAPFYPTIRLHVLLIYTCSPHSALTLGLNDKPLPFTTVFKLLTVPSWQVVVGILVPTSAVRLALCSKDQFKEQLSLTSRWVICFQNQVTFECFQNVPVGQMNMGHSCHPHYIMLSFYWQNCNFFSCFRHIYSHCPYLSLFHWKIKHF